MRYIEVDTISFTDIDGNSYPVKDIRPIDTETIAYEIDVKDGDLLDEVASRKEVYGDNGELQSYRLFDANIVKLTEAGFKIQGLKTLKVPV